GAFARRPRRGPVARVLGDHRDPRGGGPTPRGAGALPRPARFDHHPDRREPRMSVLLELDNVSAGYGDLTVVRDMSFAIEESSITVLLGPNGAGKTTLMSTIIGLISARSGSISLDGVDMVGVPPYKRQSHGIGLVQENKRIFRKLTVEQNLLYGAYGLKLKKAEAKDRLAEAYDRFPILADKRTQVAGYLSGGQQQMLG